MSQAALKRFMDIVISSSALLLLSPVILVAALAIWAEDRGHPIFRQIRVGRGGHPYELFKLRSMPINTGHVPSTEASRLRITRVGRIVRRTNIDELPQLFNILRGDMSVVGPRPALASQTHLLDLRRQSGADDCKPGLTGLAAIKAYDGMPEDEKARWDGEYASTRSFGLDCRIILRTFLYLLRRPPVY